VAIAYLGLGSNLCDRARAISEACLRLGSGPSRLLVCSSLYETEPWGIEDQPRFINAACALETDLPPHALLARVKAIESDMGRLRAVRYGPRLIDIDILLYDAVVLGTESLVLPHPGMTDRSSVLVPLTEIAGDVVHPITGLSVARHLARLGPVRGVAIYPPGL
jgi:2-amino-4-hydroxy-6-hydroxymethyldihydropteridine diphosphokinase